MIRDQRYRASCISVGLSLLTYVTASTSGVAAQEAPPGTRLTLYEAVERAIEFHPSVRSAGAMADAAESTIGEAKSSWFPQLGLNAQAIRHQKPMLSSPIHEFTPEAIPPFDRTLWGGTASLSFLVFDGGGRSARVTQARANAAAAGADEELTEMVLIARVTGAYLQALTASGVLDAFDRRAEALGAERRRVEHRLREGAAPAVELLRVEASLASIEADRVRAAAVLETAEQDLARMIGAAQGTTSSDGLATVAISDALQTEDRLLLLEMANASNPELRRARESSRAAAAGRKAASGTWFPQLDLFGAVQGFGYTEGFTAEWQVGARLSYPIFTGGARSSSVARATATARAAEEQVRLAELTRHEELDRALIAVRESGARVRATARALEHMTEVARIELLALNEGAGTQTDYLLAEANLFAARAALVESRHNEIAAHVELARVTGELSVEWLARSVETVQ